MAKINTENFDNIINEYLDHSDTDFDNELVEANDFLSKFIDENYEDLDEEQIRRIAKIDSLNSLLINDALRNCLNCPEDLKIKIDEWLEDNIGM